jgi:aryl-alcohol dehydrogenase-like predicted oxidoreductase
MRNYTSPAIAAIHGGINFIGTSLHYRHQRSERNLGAAISQMIGHGDVRRDE